jgi:hypothetical protein
MRPVDCESSEEDRRHWPRPRLTLERGSGRLDRRNLRGGERVVTDDRLSVVERRGEHAGGARRVRPARVSLQPLVERRLAAVELVEAMLPPERLG